MKLITTLLLLLSPQLLFAASKSESFNSAKGIQVGLHKENFFLPIFVNDNKQATNAVDKTEIKYQFSIKIDLVTSKKSSFSFAYTQKSFWQLYDSLNSEPFRETNYNPEFFYRVGSQGVIWDLGLEHESNGEEEPASRSWDRAYTRLQLRTTNFKLKLKLWHIIREEIYGPSYAERPVTLKDHLGIGELALSWRISKLVLKNLFRYNPSSGYGFQEHWILYPLFNSIYFSLIYSKGHGSSLRDYNRSIESYGLGIIINP